MDCSEEVQSVTEEASTELELKKGMSIFIDVSINCSVRTTIIYIHQEFSQWHLCDSFHTSKIFKYFIKRLSTWFFI